MNPESFRSSITENKDGEKEGQGNLTVGTALAIHAMEAALNPAFTPSKKTQKYGDHAKRLQCTYLQPYPKVTLIDSCLKCNNRKGSVIGNGLHEKILLKFPGRKNNKNKSTNPKTSMNEEFVEDSSNNSVLPIPRDSS